MRSLVKRILADPLLHFLLLGALILLVYHFAPKDRDAARDRIVVSRGQIENMATIFARTWQRPPSDEELNGLIRSYVREEVLYREGLALGLDRNDPVIRRRVGQKFDFLAEDTNPISGPSDDELRSYLASHEAQFTAEPRFTFRQIYLDPARRKRTIEQDSQRLLLDLRRSKHANVGALGDATLLASEFTDASMSDVEKTFGKEFAVELAQLPSGQWQGPVASAYGVHLVLMDKRTDGGALALDTIRETVKREYMRAQRAETNEKLYQGLLKRYVVTVEEPRRASVNSNPQVGVQR